LSIAGAKSQESEAARPRDGAASIATLDLIRRHRHSLCHLLVVGGGVAEREAVAMAFHRDSALRLGPFVAVDCTRDEAHIRTALRHWLSRGGRAEGAHPLWAAERGTLYLEAVGGLSVETQQLLLEFSNGGSSAAAPEGRWGGRLAVGSDEDLWTLVAEGRLVAALADSLDKIRVDLSSHRRGGAA
jgi:DNA-binding NtrC family response regulator